MGYITDLNSCTDPTTGDYLLIADASAGASDRDRKVNVSEFALTEAANTFTAAQTMPEVRSGVSGSIADDGVYSFTPSKSRGLIILSINGTGGLTTRVGVCAYDTVGPAMVAIAVGSNLNVTTGVLTGTTGTDAKTTISAHTDGKIYLENRAGFGGNWAWLII